MNKLNKINTNTTQFDIILKFALVGDEKTGKTSLLKQLIDDNFENEYVVREWEEIHLPFYDCETLIVTIDGQTFDYSDDIKKIGHNIFTKK